MAEIRMYWAMLFTESVSLVTLNFEDPHCHLKQIIRNGGLRPRAWMDAIQNNNSIHCMRRPLNLSCIDLFVVDGCKCSHDRWVGVDEHFFPKSLLGSSAYLLILLEKYFSLFQASRRTSNNVVQTIQKFNYVSRASIPFFVYSTLGAGYFFSIVLGRFV